MRTLTRCLGAWLAFAAIVRADTPAADATPAAPKATLVGETVSVHLRKNTAVVTAVYEFRRGESPGGKRLVYFPMFSTEAADPMAVLQRSDLAFEVDGKAAGVAEPCAAPRQIVGLPAGVSVVWFAADLDALRDPSESDAESASTTLRASYVQPLIRGRFYYLPLIAGYELLDQGTRAWPYQLHARGATRMPRVAPGLDYEPLGDIVVVYLKDGQFVVLD